MDQIKRAYLFLVALTVGLFLWVSIFSVLGWVSNRHRSAEGQQAHRALCVLKQDLINRRHSALEFLKDNPNGTPGISKAVILNSIKGQTATIKALSSLNCD